MRWSQDGAELRQRFHNILNKVGCLLVANNILEPIGNHPFTIVEDVNLNALKHSTFGLKKQHKIVFVFARVGVNVTFSHLHAQTHIDLRGPGVCAAECLPHRRSVAILQTTARWLHTHAHTHMRTLLSPLFCLFHHVA